LLLVAFLLVNAPNCHLPLVLASVVQGDAVNCNTCLDPPIVSPPVHDIDQIEKILIYIAAQQVLDYGGDDIDQIEKILIYIAAQQVLDYGGETGTISRGPSLHGSPVMIICLF